ncbi:MAG: cation:proton antiporter [Candidatus Omnitrophica bacterium]|nr:cation:proton antiporter [Candidatus Omnitrophota bacterium]
MEEFAFDLSIILIGSAVLSYLAVKLKQPIIVAYILCGALLGPWGLAWIKQAEFVELVSRIGVTLLLFLAGLCLHPQKLLQLFKRASAATIVNCLVSFILAFSFASILRFRLLDSICIGLALMFSSTILTVKLLPTTALHQKHMGAVCIGVLILEDLLAIMVLALIRCFGMEGGAILNFAILLFKLILFIAILILFEQYILRKIMLQVDRLHELLFILGLAWCFGIATISNRMGLFYETGAFFAGVVLARHPISFFLSEKLKPLRDFFLVLFFFALGARLNLLVMKIVLIPALLLAGIFIMFKPWLFKRMFIWIGEEKSFAEQIGFRLGQLSEFSLLIAVLAYSLGHISIEASQLIQLVTILTFIVSSYIVVYKFPTPIGTTKSMIKD